MACEIREVNRKDYARITNIDFELYDIDGYTYTDLSDALKQAKGIVFTDDGEVYGYMLFQWDAKKYQIVRLGADPDYTRKKPVVELLTVMKKKLQNGTRKVVEVIISEDFTAIHHLLRGEKFRAIETRRLYFDSERDGYVFRYVSPKRTR
jgi:ribosomal protein S18 acetylase RimI-like enzyme